jgi:pyruvate ferredoxin oxidoreductase delta subunit
MDQTSRKLEKKFNELSNRTYKAVTDLTKCISCGMCIKFCPLYIRKFNKDKKAITIKSTRYCGGCSVCFHRCPRRAIQLVKITKS